MSVLSFEFFFFRESFEILFRVILYFKESYLHVISSITIRMLKG